MKTYDLCSKMWHFLMKWLQETRAEFQSSFKSDGNRVDVLFHDTMANNESFTKLWKVVKRVLVLTRGQASVECGFS